MEVIKSLSERLESVSEVKDNLNVTIENLKQEINRTSAKIYRLENEHNHEEILNLQEKRKFLQNYSLIPKGFVKSFFKKIPIFILGTGIIFVVLLFVAFAGNATVYNFNLEIFNGLLALSGGFSIYATYLEPIIINYRRKKNLISRYGSKENIDLEINELYEQQEKNKREVENLKNIRNHNQERLENCIQLYEMYKQSEVLLNEQIQDEINRIWDGIKRDRYIYDIDLAESLSLSLNLKKNKKRFE